MMVRLQKSIRRLNALMLRDWLTRYPRGVVGPYWAQLTPILWICFIVLLFEVLERRAPINVPVTIFVAAGVLPYLAFRQTVTSLSRCLIANRYLVYVRPVTNAEILFSTSSTEAINTCATALIVFGFLGYWQNWFFPTSGLAVCYGLGLTLFLAISFGQLVARLNLFSDSLARLVPIALRPLFWISGIFYIPAELPASTLDLLWYNPLFHTIEMVRDGFFLNYSSSFASPWYPIFCACVLFLITPCIEFAMNHLGKPRYIV